MTHVKVISDNGAFKVGTIVRVDGQRGAINYVHYSQDYPTYPHSYKITDLSATGKYKSQIRLEGGTYISHARIKVEIPGDAHGTQKKDS
jgi:hypothetical protein|tara:strand:+ start:73 stop:339 length:267 start_codon:yes stop_codon:yes gene_type:complete